MRSKSELSSQSNCNVLVRYSQTIQVLQLPATECWFSSSRCCI